MAAAGGLRGALDTMLADKEFYRSAQALKEADASTLARKPGKE